MVKLTANDQAFELENGGNEIKYTKQISDIFDLAVVASSYTNSFKIPKTPHNTQIMQGLGIIGDTSKIPYSKVPSTLSYYGFTVFQNGWLSVKDTGDDYNVSCIDGMIDFFKAIENKTMGQDLNLINFNHIKDLPTVLSSFSGIYYKYIVADYNGKNLGTFGMEQGINIDYLVPCFNMGKLFDLVMTTFGFSYGITNISEINNLYITYPKSPAESTVDILEADLHLNPFLSTVVSQGSDYWTSPSSYKSWSTSTIVDGALIDNWRFQVADSSAYRIETDTEMYALYRNFYNSNTVQYKPVEIDITVNGNSIISFLSDPYSSVQREITLYLNSGDIVEFEFKVTPFELPFPRQGLSYLLREIRTNGTNLKIYKTNQGNINLGDAFKDYLIKDFIKEIFIRTATTPIIDTMTNTMTFKTIEERLDFTNADNWSQKYIRRVKESYVQGSYAQKNAFNHKYNDPDDISQNGYLYVNNQNLEANKIIYDSKIYAPDLIPFTFDTGVITNKYTVWQRETKEDADGNLSIDYKGLNGRFYIMKLQMSQIGSYTFISEAVPDSVIVTQFPFADSTGTTYNQIIPVKYNAYNGVLNNFRSHDIELALSLNDILALDLTRPKYIEKEGMYYLLNRIIFSEGDKSTGEFIRINKVLN